jgi:DHA2 family metal-tetracycline-proton antiporter-like MFS transporter
LSAGAAGGGYKISTRLLLAVLTSAVFISVLNSSMVNVAIPLIREDFGASEAQVSWVITGYLLLYAVGIPLYGRASDIFSLRRAFVLGLAVFAAGSLVCILAPSLPVLVLGRVVQAMGGAPKPALARAGVATVRPRGARGTALGLIVSSVGVGAAIGPVVGGALEQVAGWHSLFYAVLFLMLILIPSAAYALPHTESAGERGFDVPGGLLLGLAAGLFLFGITQGQVAGFGSFSSWGSFLGSALAAAGFAWRITSSEHPFVSPELFRNRGYVAAVIVGFLSMLVNVSCLVSIPLLVSQVNGLSPGGTGLVLAPGAVALAIISPLAGRLSDRIGARTPVYAGLLVMLISVLFLSAFAAGASPVVVALGMLGVGVGFAFTNSPNVNAAAAALPEESTGVGLGIFNGLFFLGGGTGPAVVGAFLAARREAGAGAINPFYGLDAAPFSDAFLLLSVALLFALAASLGLRSGKKAKVPDL